MISLEKVTKIYTSGKTVLDQISLKLSKGDFLYVVGGSGAGKSTLLRMLATEDHPTSGNLELFGYPLNRVSSSTLRAIRQSIGYVPQDIRLLPDFSVYENIALSLNLAGSRVLNKSIRTRIEDLLEHVGLSLIHI